MEMVTYAGRPANRGGVPRICGETLDLKVSIFIKFIVFPRRLTLLFWLSREVVAVSQSRPGFLAGCALSECEIRLPANVFAEHTLALAVGRLAAWTAPQPTSPTALLVDVNSSNSKLPASSTKHQLKIKPPTHFAPSPLYTTSFFPRLSG